MGYSLDQAQWEKLEKHRAEGRLCAEATGRGGCFNRATVEQTHEYWVYKIGEGDSRVLTMVFCGRHAKGMPAGYLGVNFRVISERKL